MNSILKTLQNDGLCLLDEPLSKHTTMGVGGSAKILVFPKTLEQFVEIIGNVNENGIKHLVVGNMSNLIFGDDGYNGMIISTTKIQSEPAIWNNTLTCGAGMMLANCAKVALENGLSGLEWACGIPGTVGGAVVQNAGAFGKDISTVVRKVLAFNGKTLVTFQNSDCEFAYRTSKFKTNKIVVLDACFNLTALNKSQILEKMQLLLSQRVLKQPRGKSAGSIFKNIDNISAGYLIEQAGLKGMQIGGAKISEKHANFIVNTGSATAGDIIELINMAKAKVLEKFGLLLETEIEIIDGE